MGRACPSSALDWCLTLRFVPLHWLAQPDDLLWLWESDQESKWSCLKG